MAEDMREQMELAATAAGLDFVWRPYGGFIRGSEPWNPLTDDGDALRLAVKLRLQIRMLDKCVFVETDPETLLGQSSVSELEMYGRDPDPYAATRLAIFRAAVEIGRAMP